MRSRWLISVVAALMLSMLPLVGVGAADDLTTSDTETDALESTGSGGVEVVRYSGVDRYELSIEVAEALVAAAGGSSQWVVLASGEGWTGAVVAGPLAASLGAPVVLVPPDGLQTPTTRADFVEFLRSAGARRVVIVGRPETVPHHEPSVLFGLGLLPRNVERVFDADVSSTGVAVARRIGAPSVLGQWGRTVIVSSDQSVADAVAVGPLAAAGPFPLLLTPPDALDPQIAAYLAEHEVEHVVLVGGTTAVEPAVQDTIEAAGATVTRLEGKDRLETAKLAADLFEQHAAADPECADTLGGVGLAPAQNPEQALTAGPLLAELCTRLRYSDADEPPRDLYNALYLAQHQPPALKLHVFGSQEMIPDTAVDVSLPPTRLAVVSVESIEDGSKLRAQIAVINERGDVQRFAQTAVEIETWGTESPRGFCWIHQLLWSPSGRFLTYRQDCGYSIQVLDTQTGEAYEVIHDTYSLTATGLALDGDYGFPYGAGPRWSPVDERFAFTAITDDPATQDIAWGGFPVHFAELFTHDATTRSTRRLTKNSSHDVVGTWSPDGRLIGVSRHGEPGATDPYYRVAIYSSLFEVDTGRTVLAGIGPTWARGLRWSPDGSHIAYSGGDGWWTDQAVLIKTDGSFARWLTPIDCDDCYDGHKHTGAWILGWDSTGSRLAFGDRNYLLVEPVTDDAAEIRDYSSEEVGHYTLDLATGEISVVFEHAVGAYESLPIQFLEWSLDGEALLYLRREEPSGPLELASISRDGGEFTTLAEIPTIKFDDDPMVHGRVSLSPNQRQLLIIYDRTAPSEDSYYVRNNSEDLGMWLADIGSSEQRLLLDFEDLVSHTGGGILMSPSELFPLRYWYWGCSVDWSDSGILGTCRYR